jgi:hypothetical protein
MTVSTAAAQPGTTRETFLRSLFAHCTGVIELRALPSGAQCFATLGEGRRGGQFIAEHVEENVYVGVATRRDASGGALANCRHLGALFVDIDFKRTAEREARDRLARALLPASAIVHSGGGVHAYWLLREPMSLPDEAETARGLLRRLAYELGGDRSAAEPARILRVPGTWNRKPEYGVPLRVQIEVCDATRRYNPDGQPCSMAAFTRLGMPQIAEPYQIQRGGG